MPKTVQCATCGKNHFVGSKNYQKCQGIGKSSPRATTASPTDDFAPIQHSTPITQTNLDVLEDYGIHRIMTGTLHNATEAFGDIEAYYYSTDTGQKELERREKNSSYDRETIAAMKETFPEKRDKRIPGVDTWRDTYTQLAMRGEQIIANQEQIENRRDKAVLSYVLRESLSDLSHLSADEVELVSWWSSNGSALVRSTAWDNDKEASEYIDREIRKLFDKVEPRDDINVLYRGTSRQYVPENIGDVFKISEDGLPASTTMTKDTGDYFSKGALIKMEIEEAKMIIPGAVSAWGTWEQEVLLDGDTEFELVAIEEGDSPRNRIYHVRQVV